MFKGIDSEDNFEILEVETDTNYSYKLLAVCEFTSTRKRMSCIFRDPNGKIILMCKGADSVIEERLSKESKDSEVFSRTKQFVHKFAMEGLRTLFLAERCVPEDEFEVWIKEAQ